MEYKRKTKKEVDMLGCSYSMIDYDILCGAGQTAIRELGELEDEIEKGNPALLGVEKKYYEDTIKQYKATLEHLVNRNRELESKLNDCKKSIAKKMLNEIFDYLKQSVYELSDEYNVELEGEQNGNQ